MEITNVKKGKIKICGTGGTILRYLYFSRSPLYCACLDQWMQVTAAGLFQCLISNTMNGLTRLRWEFILYNGPHKLAIESWVGKFQLEVPTFHSCIVHWMQVTAAGLFQCLIISTMNGETRLRLEFILYNGPHKLVFKSWVGKFSAYEVSPHFIAVLCMFGPVDASHSSWTVPMSYFKYNEWFDKVEMGIHSLQWSPQAGFQVMGGEIPANEVPTFHSCIVH
eukprot:scaffold54029_cov59-Cyclotella_meneghiniana.AAC.1